MRQKSGIKSIKETKQHKMVKQANWPKQVKSVKQPEQAKTTKVHIEDLGNELIPASLVTGINATIIECYQQDKLPKLLITRHQEDTIVSINFVMPKKGIKRLITWLTSMPINYKAVGVGAGSGIISSVTIILFVLQHFVH